MKIGDRVILKKFESCDSLDWWGGTNWINKEVVVDKVDDIDSTFMFADGCWWVQSACDLLIPNEPVKNERYFLFAYVSGNNTGNIWLKNEIGKVPSNKFLKEHSKKTHGLDNLVITNIFEFKSEQDYLDFTGNEQERHFSK